MTKKLDKTKPAKPERPDRKGTVHGKDSLTHRSMWCIPGTPGFTPDKKI